MGESTKDGQFIFVLLVLSTAFGVCLAQIYNEGYVIPQYKIDYCHYNERLQMFFNAFGDNVTSINGYYDHEDYYCVWVKDRPIDEVASTEDHEICHHLIEEDMEGHFCE